MKEKPNDKWSIKKQVFVFSIMISFGIYAVLIPLVLFIQTQGFGNLETIYAKDNIGRARKSVDYILSSYDRKLSDWAQWDDSYNYIVDLNKTYESTNLNQITLANLQADEVFFIGSNGKLVKAVGNEQVISQEEDFPEDAAIYFELNSNVWNRLKTEKKVSGFIKTEDGILMFAARNILPSNGEGPSRGVLVFGRYIGDWLSEDLSNLVQLPIRINENTKERDQSVLVQGNSLYGHFMLPIEGQSSGVLYEITMQRSIWNEGVKSTKVLLIAVTIVMFVLALGNYFVIYNIILKDLLKFNQEVSEIATNQGKGNVEEQGNTSEVGDLRKNVNYLLNVLNKSKEESNKTIDEMKKINSLMVNRELKMVELKKEVDSIRNKH